jgi:hypothetical protein
MSKPLVFFLRQLLSKRALWFNLRLPCAKLVGTANASQNGQNAFHFTSHHITDNMQHDILTLKKITENISWIIREKSFNFRFSSFPKTQSLIFQNSLELTVTSLVPLHFVVS